MIRRAGACLAISVLFAACTTTSPSIAPITTSEPEPTPSVTVYDLGATVYYEGLQVKIDTATATLDSGGGPVAVTIRLQNPTGDVGQLDAPIQLVIGSTRVSPNQDSAVPLVPPNGSMPVTLTYDVQGISSVDLATLEIGTAPEHVAKVPLTSRAGEALTTFDPVELALSGAGTAVDLKITLHAGEIRWDLPDWSQELDANLAVITLTYDVSYIGSFAGGFPFTGDNVALRLPDGTIVQPRRDGHSQSVELVGPHKTKKGLFSRFEIPTGLKGKCQLLVRNGGTQKTITFTIQ